MSIILNQGDTFTCKSGYVVTVKAYSHTYCDDITYYNVDFGGKNMFLVLSQSFQKEKIKRDACTIPDFPCQDWPIDYYDDPQSGLFFYICKPMPENYVTISDILAKDILIPSLAVRTDFAINIANAFNEYAAENLCVTDFYEDFIGVDLNNGSCFFGLYLQLSKAPADATSFYRFAPPEFLAKKEPFCVESNRHLMAVLLFIALFASHPLEGKKFTKEPFITKEIAEEIYENNPVFVMDPLNESNRPHSVVQHQVERLWNFYSKEIRELFIRAFCPAADTAASCVKPEDRPTPIEWLRALTNFRSSIFTCPSCGKQTFSADISNSRCSFCSNQHEPKFFIITYNSTKLPVFDGGRLYTCQTDENCTRAVTSPVGLVVSNPKNPDEMGIKNISSAPWEVITPSGKSRSVGFKEIVPMIDGIKVITAKGDFSLQKAFAQTDILTSDEKGDISREKQVTEVPADAETPIDTVSADEAAKATEIAEVIADAPADDVAVSADDAPASVVDDNKDIKTDKDKDADAPIAPDSEPTDMISNNFSSKSSEIDKSDYFYKERNSYNL